MASNIHYNEKYFQQQRQIGVISGWANLIKFEGFISASDHVLEYGCGGGFLLNNIRCAAKIGIDINPAAVKNAKELGLDARQSIDDVPDEWADIIISNHVLEHVRDPLEVLVALRQKLKKQGKIIFVVPCEPISAKYKRDDINQHLYTWAPINLGNLFTSAGYVVESCEPFMHKWNHRFMVLKKLFGEAAFHFASRVFSYINRSHFQVRIVARLP